MHRVYLATFNILYLFTHLIEKQHMSENAGEGEESRIHDVDFSNLCPFGKQGLKH